MTSSVRSLFTSSSSSIRKGERAPTSMDDVIGMQIIHRLQYLFDGLRGILFRELALLADSIKQLPSRG